MNELSEVSGPEKQIENDCIQDVQASEPVEQLTDAEREIEAINPGRDEFDRLLATSEISREKSDDLSLEEVKENYIGDLMGRSEVPETIDVDSAKGAEYVKCEGEELASKRAEFTRTKADLKHEWEDLNGREWPKYTEDVYSNNGVKIRVAGQDYDAHHIQSLEYGGKNEATNITPLHATEHFDRQGVHAPNSPYSEISKCL